MSDAEKSAFPSGSYTLRASDLGLTKREYFAIRALQGLLAARTAQINSIALTEWCGMARVAADTLLAELAKPRK